MEFHNCIEYAKVRDLVSKEADIYNSDKTSEVDAGNSSPDFTEEDGRKWCFCQTVA